MQTLPNYYYIPTGITRDVAELIVKKCDELQLENSTVTNEGLLITKPSWRKSTNAWIPMDHWIAGMMKHFVESANVAEFNYDLTKWSDQIQYTVYDGDGSHYGWHTDIVESVYDPKVVRKLSISLLLSDPEDYEGGEFQLLLAGDGQMKSWKPPIGTAVIFPSTAKHRVRPVKSGKRISLVGWYGGPAFR